MTAAVCSAPKLSVSLDHVHGSVEEESVRPSERKKSIRPSQVAAKILKGPKSDGGCKTHIKVRVRKRPPTKEETLTRKKQKFSGAFEAEVKKFMSIPGASLAMTAWGLQGHDKELLQEMKETVDKVTNFAGLLKALTQCEERMKEYKDYFYIMNSIKEMIAKAKDELEPFLEKESQEKS